MSTTERKETEEQRTPYENARVHAIEHDLEDVRDRVADSLGELRERFAEAADWHGWVRKHPVALTLAAFAIGYVIGRRIL